MSSIVTSNVRRANDHFEPEADLDPQAQRRLRGQLEKIDYTAFASNKEVIGAVLGKADGEAFQKMALACAQARAAWIKEAIAQTAHSHRPGPEAISRLAQMRQAYEELAAAYETMRRMVERGYLPF